jgi:hypothetical protein
MRTISALLAAERGEYIVISFVYVVLVNAEN